MTITFENDNDVITYALEKLISYAKDNQYIFVAQCVWSLSSIIGLEQGLVSHIDNIRNRKNVPEDTTPKATSTTPMSDNPEDKDYIQTDRINQVDTERKVSATPRDRTEDQQLDNLIDNAARFLYNSARVRDQWQLGRVNPLPQTKTQLRKARKVKRLQETKDKAEHERQRRLQEILAEIIRTLSKE